MLSPNQNLKASRSNISLHQLSQLSHGEDDLCHSHAPNRPRSNSEGSYKDDFSDSSIVFTDEPYDLPTFDSDHGDDASKMQVDSQNSATTLARYVKSRTGHMKRALTSEPKKYFYKLSGAIGGGSSHYPGRNDTTQSFSQSTDADSATRPQPTKFHEHFGFSDLEELRATHFATLRSFVPMYGKVYISTRHFCFRSMVPFATKIVFPIEDIETVTNCKNLTFRECRLIVTVRRYPDYFFDFRNKSGRDSCSHLLRELITMQLQVEDEDLHKTVCLNAAALEAAQEEIEPSSKQENSSSLGSPLSPLSEAFDDMRASMVDFKPEQPLHFTCLTIGSRGDVQPYIALCKGLIAEGHKCRIATHREFESWVRSYGIEFAPVDGEPAALIQLCIENGMFTPAFLQEAMNKFSDFIVALLESSKLACRGTDVLIESPSAMAGIHVAEAMQIPYFRAFTMPWTKTEVYPHAFAVPDQKRGALYNKASYYTFDRVFWLGIYSKVNSWRKKSLNLERATLEHMHLDETPFLYNFSPSVVPPPIDYPDCVHVTGYWFLDDGAQYTPPRELVDFLDKARRDEKKIVYIGFGSMVVDDAAALSRVVVDAVLSADVRCILSKGWSDRHVNDKGKEHNHGDDIPTPPEIFHIKSAPHDWLFSQVDVAVHHGGAGTTGASLRAGVPTIVKPFFGDQFFFGQRVEDLGVGMCLNGNKFNKLPDALKRATTEEFMIQNARRYGRLIRKENGVEKAIETIYREMERARTITLRRAHKHSHKPTDDSDDNTDEVDEDVTSDGSWTFVDSPDT